MENLIENQFPAPGRRFAGGKRHKASKTKKSKSSNRSEGSSSNLKRQVLERLDSNVHNKADTPKRPRVNYDDGSDDELISKKKKDVDNGDGDEDFKGKNRSY